MAVTMRRPIVWVAVLACLAACTARVQAGGPDVPGRPSRTLWRQRRLLNSAAATGGQACPNYNQLYKQLHASEADVIDFINSLDGTVILLGQPQYDKARNLTEAINEVYNYRTPLMVVYCSSEQDAAAAVKFAAERRLPLCARAGGHDTSGASICEGGVVVDVSRLSQINILPEEGVAYIQAGVRFQDLTAALKSHGMAAIEGLCPTVGISGYTMGGGWGMLSKMQGTGADNVLSYTVALPDGRIVVANKSGEYSDLYWAMRGGGHNNFGIMTSMRYRIFKPPAKVWTYNVTFNAGKNPKQAAKALKLWQDHFLGKPPAALTVFPNFVGGKGVDQLVVIYATYANASREARREMRALMEPFQQLGPQDFSFDSTTVWDFPELTAGSDPVLPANVWEVKRGQYANSGLSLKEFQLLVEGWKSQPAYPANYSGPVITIAYLEGMEGAITNVRPSATAFVHRKLGFDLVVDALFVPGPGVREAALEWQANLYDKRWKGLLNGQAYQNYPSEVYKPSQALRMYYGSNLCRLVAVKKKYDPTRVFDSEQGVPPSFSGC